jgi:photoactive yellow protein
MTIAENPTTLVLPPQAPSSSQTLHFATPLVHPIIEALDEQQLDQLDFGVIGIDSTFTVRRYNAPESEMAGLSLSRVVGHPLFTVVAPCMNNYLVAQRFEDAATHGETLDATIDYVFTLRMRPVKVKLRLLSSPSHALAYVLVQRAR